MGSVFEELTLENAGDVLAVQRGRMKESEIRSVVVNALVDTDAGTLVITEEVNQILGLKVHQIKESTLADGSKHMYKRMEPIRIHWKDRDTFCVPTMIPGAENILLGVIPLEDMDLMVDPKNEMLVGRHGDHPVGRV